MIEIVDFAPRFVEGVYKLENECFSSPWSKESFEKVLYNPRAIYYVALLDEQVVGYIGIYDFIDELDILNVAVSDRYRRHGVALSLLDKVYEYAKNVGIGTISLEVRKSNTPAISLYEKSGFKKIGIRKDYYTQPKEDALIFKKKLFDTL